MIMDNIIINVNKRLVAEQIKLKKSSKLVASTGGDCTVTAEAAKGSDKIKLDGINLKSLVINIYVNINLYGYTSVYLMIISYHTKNGLRNTNRDFCFYYMPLSICSLFKEITSSR